MHASLELCKELYELSGWGETLAYYEQSDGIPPGEPYIVYPELIKQYGLWGTQEVKVRTPAYDAGYLLRKLPRVIEEMDSLKFLSVEPSPISSREWEAGYSDENYDKPEFVCYSETVEDCLASLAIELFKENIIKRGE